MNKIKDGSRNAIDLDKLQTGKSPHKDRFLETVLESLTHPFYVIDTNDYTIKTANSAARLGRISGTATCYALTHRADKPCGMETHPYPLEIVKNTKKPATVEHILYDKDGNLRNVEVHGFPVFDNNGHVIQMIEYCLDITDRKNAEKAMHQSEQERQCIGQELHDSIGQQLTGIAFMMEVLSEKLADKTLTEEVPYAQRINARISRAVDLARNLAKGLHPIDLDKNGLLPALEELVAHTEQLFNISCTFTCD